MSRSFSLVREQNIPELNSLARLYVHKRTGARLLSVINDEENKVFSINFRTTPKDSTGVAHILEHSVLNGSEKYPVKEPFVELIKGSLATFINAMTYPDKTLYPVASQNLQDFYNLIDVYVDAVLHPILSEQTLMQEGWHYEIENPNDPLIYKGVVFNEMKGAYSDPDGVLETRVVESLFPKHIYGVDSGGDPRHIPDLTYANFRAFWETYYHPSNAFIFFYGNDDPEKRLKLMETYLKPYKRKKVKSTIKLAKPFKKPKQVKAFYDAGGEEDIAKKHFLTVNWVLPDSSDVVLNYSLRILGHILIGTPASPLRKALLDSGLGEDLAGTGMETSLRQFVFSTGLKGTRARSAKKIEALILDTLRTLVRDGIDPDMVAAAMNTIEFSLRENNTGRFPRGISIMTRILTTWLYDEDPFKLFAFEAPLNAIKGRLAADSRYFESLIQAHLLENTHRTTLRLIPDPELGRRSEEAEKTRLAEIRAGLSEAQIAALIEQTKQLKLRQETPDTNAALESLPMLKRSDLERQSRTIPIEVSELQDAKILYHDLSTNGLLYLNLGFDLHTLPVDLIPLAGLFPRALLEMGTQTEDYVKLSQRIGKSTGGVYGSTTTAPIHGSKESVARLFLSGKSTAGQTSDMLNIMRDVLLHAKFDNRERFKQIVMEERAGQESMLVPRGHMFVNMRLRAQFGETGWLQDQMDGISYLFALRELEKETDKKWASVLKKLETLRDLLINRKALVVNVTVDAANWANIRPQLEAFLGALPARDVTLNNYNIQPQPKREGLTIPAQVNYVGKGLNLYETGYQPDGAALVVNNYMQMTYLWEKIRVQGGAYGGFASFDDVSGVFSFLSYRDPNLAATLDHYDKTGEFLKTLDSSRLSDNELTKAIISTIGELDGYQLPDAKGFTSMMRHLTGRTDALRQKLREEVLSANGEDFIALGEALEKVAQSNAVTVLGSQAAIESANAGLEVTKVL